jgi:hypothetical protein
LVWKPGLASLFYLVLEFPERSKNLKLFVQFSIVIKIIFSKKVIFRKKSQFGLETGKIRGFFELPVLIPIHEF